MKRQFSLKGFDFYIDGESAEVQIADNNSYGVFCSTTNARAVYRAVSKGALEHSESKTIQQTIKDIRDVIHHTDLFGECEACPLGYVAVIAIRKDGTAYVKKYSLNQWEADMMLGRQKAYMDNVNGKFVYYEYE